MRNFPNMKSSEIISSAMRFFCAMKIMEREASWLDFYLSRTGLPVLSDDR